ncbi:hypothetical protein K466DRAFT_595903 [Polyporus arcularius HHB13444]|uniref:Pre-rRNA-processing protein n=1 Tax=Polyporus arcularius HHB13444 TaxID=1314778 RepID=A0A5C3PPK7_9APHY|nr:hypothetical protein K466DRAFT_595903 [Polyporus arcularius HHB13444]
MPKSTKKKKDKAADFSKAKLKLGKGKQAPTNAIDTSFKARSIALPTQSIAVDKDTDAPSTKRKLTFEALIAHTKHYNANTRKDAILGLRELLEGHPGLITVHLTQVVNSCVRLIGDEDGSVRKGLLSFFTWLFRQVPPDNLIPHSPVLLLFTTSAQTHIFPEIRIDAVRFLDIYLEYIPDIVTEGWMYPGGGAHGRRVLEGYLGILNAGTTFGEGGDTGPVQATSTASVVLSPASKLVVLKSLASFLSHAIKSAWHDRESAEASSSTVTTPTWYLSSSFASSDAFDAFDALLRPIISTQGSREPIRTWRDEVSPEEDGFVGPFPLACGLSSAAWTIGDLNDVDAAISTLKGDGTGEGTSADVSCAVQLARTVHSTLVSTFLDCAPTVFSPSSSPPETELQMILVVCRICRSLYGRILQDAAEAGTSHQSAEADLQNILSYLSPYFPFTITGPSTMRRDMKTEQAFQDLNLIFCELSSFLLLASQRHPSHKPMAQGKTLQSGKSKRAGVTAASMSAVQTRQIERVSAYIAQLLQGQPSAGVQSSLLRQVTPQAYSAVLPTIWCLLNGQTPDLAGSSELLFAVVLEHATRASSASVVKRLTVDFIGRLVLLDGEAEYIGTFRPGTNEEQAAKLQEWVLQLPKTLWELGGSHLTTTEAIIRLLLRLCHRRSRLLQPATITALRSRLVPYFCITHPARGRIPGPYAKLPLNSSLRHLVLDLVAMISRTGPLTSVDDELGASVTEAVGQTAEAAYWYTLSTRP